MRYECDNGGKFIGNPHPNPLLNDYTKWNFQMVYIKANAAIGL
jgi:hypothetical protein